jgi:magnesium transporter
MNEVLQKEQEELLAADLRDREDGYSRLPELLMRTIIDALDDEDLDKVRHLVGPLGTEDQAELFNRVKDAHRELLTQALHGAFNSDILPLLDADAADEVIQALGAEETAKVIASLDTEDAVQIISELDEDEQQEILESVDEDTRQELEEALSYPEYSAGRLMRKNMVYVPQYWTVGDTIDYLRTSEGLPEDFYAIYVVDPKFHPVGDVLLSKIMQNKRECLIQDIMNSKLHPQKTFTDQEEVAYVFRKYGLVESPVIDERGKLVGTITVDDVVYVLQDESEDDFLKAGGVREQDIHAGIFETVGMRFPWLFVNLLTAVAASAIISMFGDTIQRMVLLAVLMPIIASMGGNAGIQAATVAVRAIATKRLTPAQTMSYITKEVTLGALNGIGIAIATSVGIWLLYGDVEIAVIFSVATILNMMVAGFCGATLPMLFIRLGVDPAISAGVFLTMFTDMFGFFVFLGLAALVTYGHTMM